MNKINLDILRTYLNKKADSEDYASLNRWVEESKEHADELFMLEESLDREKLAASMSPSNVENQKAALFERIRKAEQSEKETSEQKISKSISFSRYWVYMAASFALFLTIGLGCFQIYKSLKKNEIQYVQVPLNGDVQKIVLSDGTTVWLNKGSELKYPLHFSSKKRVVELHGEAYFEVKRDHLRPFLVQNEDVKVRVLGTSFNLRSFKNNPLIETSLIEGSVEVSPRNGDGKIVLSPGQKAELNRNSGQIQIKQVDAKLDAVWSNDLIPFDKATIQEIASVLERFYAVKIILSPDITESTYSGVLHHSDHIEKVLHSLTNSIPITYRKNGDNYYLLPTDK